MRASAARCILSRAKTDRCPSPGWKDTVRLRAHTLTDTHTHTALFILLLSPPVCSLLSRSQTGGDVCSLRHCHLLFFSHPHLYLLPFSLSFHSSAFLFYLLFAIYHLKCCCPQNNATNRLHWVDCGFCVSVGGRSPGMNMSGALCQRGCMSNCLNANDHIWMHCYLAFLSASFSSVIHPSGKDSFSKLFQPLNGCWRYVKEKETWNGERKGEETEV